MDASVQRAALERIINFSATEQDITLILESGNIPGMDPDIQEFSLLLQAVQTNYTALLQGYTEEKNKAWYTSYKAVTDWVNNKRKEKGLDII